MLPFDAKKLQEPPKFVHRLSTEITGILLLARHKAAAAYAKALHLQHMEEGCVKTSRTMRIFGGDIIEHGFLVFVLVSFLVNERKSSQFL